MFVAHLPQNDLGRIGPGLRATINAPGRSAPIVGVVHGFLPADTSTMSVPVRIDLQPSGGAAVPIGLFGTAHIAVAQRPNAVIIPAAAILRDDVNGTTRVAVVDAGGRAHWTMVSAGVQQGNVVEVLSPPLVPGTRVIVSGQVGLPDSSHVVEAPADSTSISGERAPTAQP